MFYVSLVIRNLEIDDITSQIWFKRYVNGIDIEKCQNNLQ